MDNQLFSLNESTVTVQDMLIFIIFISFFFILGSFVRRVLLKRVFTRFDLERGLQYTLARVTQYIIIIIGALISFQFIGLNLTSLAFVFGLLSVGIGFGLQNITANFISGLIIMFERPISVGDRVEVAGVEGDVTEINIRSTNIKSLNNITIIVPNSQFVENNVINYSHGDSTFRLDIDVGVSYASDLERVIKALDEVVTEHKDKLNIRRHDVHLIEFGDSSWNMQLRIWIPDVRQRYELRNLFNQTVVHKFDKYEIEIPFPQRDLHLRSAIPVNTTVGRGGPIDASDSANDDRSDTPGGTGDKETDSSDDNSHREWGGESNRGSSGKSNE